MLGTSTLYHLTASGCSDCVLVERDTLASGSTSKAAGGIRLQFSDELNIRIGLENVRRFERFSEEFGVDIGYHQWGYLFLLTRPDDVEAFTQNVALQNSLGVPSRVLTAAEAAAIVPGVAVDDVLAATFCPKDGYATPESAVQGYAQAAARGGARIVQGCAASRIILDRGRVVGVETAAGTIATERVVLTAGVWSKDLAATVGVEIPVEPMKRHVWFTDQDDQLPRELPLVIDFTTGFYFHREGQRILFGGRHPTIDELAPEALERLPALGELAIRDGWWGYYEMSPDHNALVGLCADPDGLLYATGFSGHGFQQGPVVGEHLALLALGHETRFDLTPFAIERFARGDVKVERNIV